MAVIREDEIAALRAEFDTMQATRKGGKFPWTPEQEAMVLYAMGNGHSANQVQRFFKAKGWPCRAFDTITKKYKELNGRADS